MTREQLTKPDFNGRSIDQYLIDLGINISPRTKDDTEDRCNIRIGMNHAIYGFKSFEDGAVFTKALEDEDISFAIPPVSTGARYPYHVVLEIEPSNIKVNDLPSYVPDKTDRTYYTPEALEEALNLVKTLKNITVRSQDYHTSAYLRDIEKHFTNKIENDKNRKI